MSDIPADAPLDFEAAYATLEESVRRLESGTLNLDEAMTEYERGVALSSRCSQLLEAAEQRVSQIVVGGPQPIPGDPGE
ncbi:MAG: exodeoxyribonuclease VII small subunit [Anaerolineae bacterium]|jgi:exodeoxyribonuclease VII small subunit|nr:exodeoxyribonuclease VII small subunit [Ardenticatenia bacterium]HQZ71155.1 exodeoxyribonuclease VII small subunit [Anaerolineae bacterium]HRA19220.1 exodeoxyribonuclease VII small subunit [Anaerolineae bacterium]